MRQLPVSDPKKVTTFLEARSSHYWIQAGEEKIFIYYPALGVFFRLCFVKSLGF